MGDVGVRELKQHLSEYLRRAEQGEVIGGSENSLLSFDLRQSQVARSLGLTVIGA